MIVTVVISLVLSLVLSAVLARIVFLYTSLRRLNDDLKKRLRLTETLLKAIPVAVFYKDAEGRYLGCNEEFTNVMGVTSDEIAGKTVYDLWPMELSATYDRQDKELLKNPRRQVYDFEVRNYLGRKVPVIYHKSVFYDENSAAAGIIGVFFDITERKKTEQRMSLLDFALNHVHEAAFLIDERAHFQFVNEDAGRVLGYSREELLEMSVQDIDPDFPAHRWRSHWDELRGKGSILFEGRHRMKDGRDFPVEISANYFEYEGRAYNLALVRDITERKQAERERQAHLWFMESLDRINRAIHGSSDLDRMMKDALEEVSAVFQCDRTGFIHPCDPGSPVFRVPMEVTKPEYAGTIILNTDMPMPPEMAGNMREALASSGPLVYAAGTDKPVNGMFAELFGVKSMMVAALHPKSGKPWAFGIHQCSHPRVWTREEMKLFREIAGRLADCLGIVLAYRDLRDGLEKLEDAQRIAHIGYWDHDFLSGRISLAAEACRILGLPPQENVHDLEQWRERWLALVHPDDRHRADQAYVDALQGGARYSIDYRIIHPDGDVRYIHSEATVARDASGRPLRMRGMIQDISGQKLAEESLLKMNEELDRRVRERTAELESKVVEIEHMNRLFVGRELRMQELKQKIEDLENKS